MKFQTESHRRSRVTRFNLRCDVRVHILLTFKITMCACVSQANFFSIYQRDDGYSYIVQRERLYIQRSKRERERESLLHFTVYIEPESGAVISYHSSSYSTHKSIYCSFVTFRVILVLRVVNVVLRKAQ